MIVNKQTIFNNKIDVKNSSNSISLNTCLLSNLLNNKTNGREMAGSNPVEKVKVHPSVGKEIKSPINKNLWVFCNLESCRSGLTGLPAKQLLVLMRAIGSNPILSANFNIETRERRQLGRPPCEYKAELRASAGLF